MAAFCGPNAKDEADADTTGVMPVVAPREADAGPLRVTRPAALSVYENQGDDPPAPVSHR
jgi:hypothetical protein